MFPGGRRPGFPRPAAAESFRIPGGRSRGRDSAGPGRPIGQAFGLGGGARRYRSPAPPIPPTLPQLPRASDPFNTDGLRGGSQGQGGHAPPHPPTHTPSTHTPSTHSTHPSTYPHSKHPPSPHFRLTRERAAWPRRLGRELGRPGCVLAPLDGVLSRAVAAFDQFAGPRPDLPGRGQGRRGFGLHCTERAGSRTPGQGGSGRDGRRRAPVAIARGATMAGLALAGLAFGRGSAACCCPSCPRPRLGPKARGRGLRGLGPAGPPGRSRRALGRLSPAVRP